MFAEWIHDKLRLFLLKTKTEQTAILFSFYLSVHFIFSGIEYRFLLNIVPLLVFLVVVLALREHLFTAWFWAVATFLMVIRVANDPYVVANHDYLIAYVSFLMTLVYFHHEEQRDAFLKRQAMYVFALVMLLAGLQKMLSPEYENGSQLEFMFLTGDFAKVIFNREIFFANEIAANKEVFFRFGRSFVENPNERFVWHSPFFHSIARPLAWLIILSELAFGLLALWFFQRKAFQICFALFIAGVFVITPEGGFLSLLLIIGWSQLPAKPAFMHYTYMCFLFLALSFIITRNSFG